MEFKATKRKVEDQGQPPDSFLEELVEWARQAPDEIFAPNDMPDDIFGIMAPVLGNSGLPHWDNLLHRKSALLENMRVHAGFESAWKWNASVDTTNLASMNNINAQETGIFQVSFDSTGIHGSAMRPFAAMHGIGEVHAFISQMKLNHRLALEYYARLVRVSYRWAGPLVRSYGDSVRLYWNRAAMAEFQTLLQ